MAQLNFDATTVEPSSSFDPIPPGKYRAAIIESEMKPTSKGGAMLKLTLKITEGEFAGRKLFDNLNIQNANPVAQEIAYKTLSAICHACGIMQVEDSSQLHGIELEVKVAIRPAQGDYNAQNIIKGYSALGTGQQNAVPPFVAAQQTSSPSAPVTSAPVAPQAQQWTPPTIPQPPVAPVQQAAPQAKLRFFKCNHCGNVITDYNQIPCPKCTCPNTTEFNSLAEATTGQVVTPPVQQAPAPTPAPQPWTPPVQQDAPVAPQSAPTQTDIPSWAK